VTLVNESIIAEEGPDVGRELRLTVGEDLRVVDSTEALASICGEAPEKLRGQHFSELFLDPDAALKLCDRVLELGFAQGHFLDLRSGAGDAVRLLCRAVQSRGRSRLLQVTARELPALRSEALAAGPDQNRFRGAFEGANIGIGLVGLDGNLFLSNPKLTEILGFPKAELETMNLIDLTVPGEHAVIEAQMRKMMDGSGDQGGCERRFLSKTGLILAVDVSLGLNRSESGEPRYFVASFRDVTESRRQEMFLKEQAAVDPLTRVLNRSSLEERGKAELARAVRNRRKFSLAMVDLDHFKLVNDTYGHAVGDLVLRGFGELSHECLRVSDLLGRWGGEEFVIVLPDTGPECARRVAERLRASLEEFVFPSGVRVTASMGIAGYRRDETFASLLHRADGAMYAAKQAGRNKVLVDAADLAADIESRRKPRSPLTLRWKKSYASGEARIDLEHQGLMQVANRLLAASSMEGAEAEVRALIGELLTHIRTHFEHEEEMLQTVQYPRFDAHREIHRRLLTKADGMVRRLDRGEEATGDLVGFVIHDMVARHVLREDREFFPWVNSVGGQPRQQAENSR
jgi:diguanylate cyclase (GGDEF)-like protein/hemerythrin-like metal-binding protein/PAS domain S-box-containing protein